VSAPRPLVLGAGPTGLSAALNLGPDAVLVEKESKVGGSCRSLRAGGFTFDMAGHAMFSSDPYVHDLYRVLLGDNIRWLEREAWVYSNGTHTRYGNGHANGNGHGNGNGHANGHTARFGYPLKGGLQALMDGFLAHLRAEVCLETEAVRVSPSRRTVVLSDGSTIPYEAVISTIPLPRLVRLMGAEATPPVRDAAAGLRYRSVRCVNLGVGRPALTEKHWIYYPDDAVFGRVFVPGNASPHSNPPGGFGLTCEITYAHDHPLPAEGDALVRRCIHDCREVGLIGEHDPIWTACQTDQPYAYIAPDPEFSQHEETRERMEHIRAWLLDRDVVLAGSLSEWEYDSSDHAFAAGREAAVAARRRCDERREAARRCA
jgi:protoporphyrinogen oxidase